MKKLLFFIFLLSGIQLAASEDISNYKEGLEESFSYEKDNLLTSFYFIAGETSELQDGPIQACMRNTVTYSDKVFNFQDPEVNLRIYIDSSQFIQPGLSLYKIIFPFHSVF